MAMYNLSIFLWSHLIAGVIALIISFLFYKETVPKAIEEFNRENTLGIKINMTVLSVIFILFGWYTLIKVLKSIFDYYFEPDEEDDDE
jgi:cytochrome c oxidase assembly factor CtaG